MWGSASHQADAGLACAITALGPVPRTAIGCVAAREVRVFACLRRRNRLLSNPSQSAFLLLPLTTAPSSGAAVRLGCVLR